MRVIPGKALLIRCWHFLWQPSLTWPWLALVVVGVGVGVAGAGATAGALWFTSTDVFCESCHQIAIVPEWKQSVHSVNTAGIQVGCAECHEPHEPIGMMLRKIAAVDEVWNQLRGTISTPEKFESHRLELAQKEWARLRGDGSEECQSCHQVARINDPGKTFLSAMHRTALANGRTCIDCHKGVAHKAPEEHPAALTR